MPPRRLTAQEPAGLSGLRLQHPAMRRSASEIRSDLRRVQSPEPGLSALHYQGNSIAALSDLAAEVNGGGGFAVAGFAVTTMRQRLLGGVLIVAWRAESRSRFCSVGSERNGTRIFFETGILLAAAGVGAEALGHD